MPKYEATHTVTVALDGLAGIEDLELSALEFARTAPAALIAAGVESMIEDLVTEVCGVFGFPIADDQQIDAPWACGKCGSMRGFRRRGAQVRQRKLMSRVGQIAISSKMIYFPRVTTASLPWASSWASPLASGAPRA